MHVSLQLTPLPAGASVRRRVDLDEDSDAAYPRVVGQILDVVGRVDLVPAVRPPPGHLRELGRVEGEALGIGYVPVEGVQLGRRHPVDHAFQTLDGEELPPRVDQQSPVGERGLVLDRGAGQHPQPALPAARLVPPDHLAKRLQPVPGPEVAPPDHPGLQHPPLRRQVDGVRLVHVQARPCRCPAPRGQVYHERVHPWPALRARRLYQAPDVACNQGKYV